MTGQTINGKRIFVEFPRTNEERQAIQNGIDQKELDKAKKTVYMSNLNPDVTQQQIQHFCSKYGEIAKVKIPSNGRQGIAFIEFVRKGCTDDFIEQMKKERLQIGGSDFKP
eukprot:UN05377